MSKSKIADQQYTLICQLTPNVEQVIQTRVINIWETKIPTKNDGPVSLDYLLIDEKGDVVQAFCEYNQARWIKPLLKKDHIIRMRNFSVLNNLRRYRHAFSKVIIKITRNTSIKTLDEDFAKIPRTRFDFIGFEVMPSRWPDNVQLSDIVAQVTVITLPGHRGDGAKAPPRIVLDLKDESGLTTKAAIWDDFGDALNHEELLEKSKNGPILIAMK
ncbi:replication protein A 70 kDa DNA-binding subunit B-like [Canna indica]|uniref:Replication protein A 70 kDa DNA-binding subunit B-like n=1 Tax=Canna indica TaxID=4628 RepID=A0AAQ3KN64_9LILI|nr:replication protein A 70 kDa DNA-binding subunit B-like [Canna indica]